MFLAFFQKGSFVYFFALSSSALDHLATAPPSSRNVSSFLNRYLYHFSRVFISETKNEPNLKSCSCYNLTIVFYPVKQTGTATTVQVGLNDFLF